MAGDWIKMRSNLKDDPDVVVMAGRLEMDELSVVGRLHAVWAWLDQHTETGTNVRITSAYLDRLTSCSGFADAMRAVGWLSGRDGDLTFPNFLRHNGESAKRRASETKRKQKSRSKADKCPPDGGTNVPQDVPHPCGPEKRREEVNTNANALVTPDGASETEERKSVARMTTEEFIAALKDNPAYQHLSIDRELAKMDAWLLDRPGKQKTRRFVVNWLNKAPPPLEIDGKNRSAGQQTEAQRDEQRTGLKQKIEVPRL